MKVDGDDDHGGDGGGDAGRLRDGGADDAQRRQRASGAARCEHHLALEEVGLAAGRRATRESLAARAQGGPLGGRGTRVPLISGSLGSPWPRKSYSDGVTSDGLSLTSPARPRSRQSGGADGAAAVDRWRS